MMPKLEEGVIGTTLHNRYRLDAELGHGGVAVVYRAYDTLLERGVAVKVLSATLLDTQGRANLLREARAAASLNHPNIVTVHDAGEVEMPDKDEPAAYIVMELVAGSSLHEQRPKALDDILDIACQMCSGLEHAHANGVIHRDLKPENVLLTPGGTAKLADFGLARSVASRLTGEGVFVGTVFYVAPEQALGQELDGRADLYALGVMLYELTAGQLPFTGDDPLAIISQHLHAPVVPPSTHNDEIPPGLDALIVRLLRKQPQDRPPSATAVMQTLDELLQSSGTLARRSNLPAQSTHFVGRIAELSELETLLANPHVRLLTVVGAGGMGKTRLALEAAARQLHRYDHGTFFVSLAPLESVEDIVPAIAKALGFSFRKIEREPYPVELELRQQLLDYLRQKRLLLVMDNFEHLLDGIDLVTDVIQTAPEVKILVTSRERLNLQGEQLFHLSGMHYPAMETYEVQQLLTQLRDGRAQYSAVQLFLSGARRIRPSFRLTANNLVDVVRVCQLVDGMPLGIELAAGWVDVLSLADIAAEIQRGLDLLETEWRDIPERHRSIRAVFDASWELLSQAERNVFLQISVFCGGFTRAAAVAVAGTSMRTLAGLVSKSLLHYNKDQDRYAVHELLLQYAKEKLAQEPNQESAARDRHSAFYCKALQAWEADLKGARQLAALAEIETDLENVRVAWEWAVDQGRVAHLDMAMDGLGWFHSMRWRFQRGEEMFRLAAHSLAQVGETPSRSVSRTVASDPQRVLAKLTLWRSQFSLNLDNRELARTLLEQSQVLLNSRALTGQDTRAERGFLCRLMGIALAPDWEEALQYHKEGVSLYRELGDRWSQAYNLIGLGVVNAECGNHDQAIQAFEESLASFGVLDSRWGMARAVNALGFWAWTRCHYDQARRWYEEGLALSKAQGDKWDIAASLGHLGGLAQFQGRFEAAAVFLRQSITIHRETGNRHALVNRLNELSFVYWLSGEFDQAYAAVEEGLSIARGLGAGRTWLTLTHYAVLDAVTGKYTDARARAQTAINLKQEAGAQGFWNGSYAALGWVALAEEKYAEAESDFQRLVAATREWMDDPQYEALFLGFLGLAMHGQGNQTEAKRHLLGALEIVVEIRAFVPLMHLMPVIPVVLINEDELNLQERAVEVYAMAESHPLVARAQLFKDIAGRYIKAVAVMLPPEIVEAARKRGQTLDWWEAAEALLEELKCLGWTD